MAIFKNMDIKISEGVATFNEKFYVYQNDKGIELHLKLNLFKTSFGTPRKRITFTNPTVFVGATILKPSGDVIGRERIELENDIIRFKIDEDLTNDVDEIGVYKIQFHLYDEEDNRITIPPVTFEVKELIGIVGQSNNKNGVVGRSNVNECVVAEETNTIDIFLNGKYIKTQWLGGDLITAEKLNKIEIAIETVNDKLNNVLVDDMVNIDKVAYSTANDPNILTVKDALDKLLYFDLTINLSSNKSATLEKGNIVSNTTFSWTYNKSIVSQSFNNVSLDSSVRSYTYNDSFSTNKTFTLNANDGSKNFSKSIGFNFYNGRYWGVSDKSDYNSDFIKSLSKELSSSRGKTFTVNCGAGQHIYYCIPTSFGTPTFTVGGFSGGFSKVSTIQYSNAHGHVENYDIWKSTNSNLGNTTVVVS